MSEKYRRAVKVGEEERLSLPSAAAAAAAAAAESFFSQHTTYGKVDEHLKVQKSSANCCRLRLNKTKLWRKLPPCVFFIVRV
jgi:hypothetical protein